MATENTYNIVGLCAGRHELPVSTYIFEHIDDVLDFSKMNSIAEKFVVEHCHPRFTSGQGVNQTGYTVVKCLISDDPLNVVVTGLTACTVAVMWACALYGVDLTLWHFDRDSGKYMPQHCNFSGRWYTENNDDVIQKLLSGVAS